MFNLLPPEDKELAKKEYGRRLAVVGLFWTCLALFSFLIMLAPSLLDVFKGEKEAESKLTVLEKKPAVSDYKELTEQIKTTRMKLEILKSAITNKVFLVDYLVVILRGKPDGATITDFSWVAGETGLRITVNGQAKNREILRKFDANLRSERVFSEVSLPISSFAKPEEVDFSITIQVDQTKT